MLTYLGRYSEFTAQIAAVFPKSVHLRNKYYKISKVDITKYVVCPKCHSLYSFDECLVKCGSRYTVKSCPHSVLGKVCGARLLKEVVSRNGNPKFYPFLVFPYCSVISTLKRMFTRPGFLELCEQTRLMSPGDLLQDVMDGKIWREFQKLKGKLSCKKSTTMVLF